MEMLIQSFDLIMKGSLLLMDVFLLGSENVHQDMLDILHFVVYFYVFDASTLNRLEKMTKNNLTIVTTSKGILIALLCIFLIRVYS
jgi:hypothetical protein